MKRMIYNFLKEPYANVSAYLAFKQAQKQAVNIKNISEPFFITGIPGSLHLIDLCLRFIPDNQNVVIVANGLTDWEYRWALDNFRMDGHIRFLKMLRHADVLDFLFKHMDEPFGILDYDCFVLDPSFFSKISVIKHNHMLNAVFVYQNTKINIEIPETFILYFNTPVMKEIQQKYRVNAQRKKHHQLSRKIKDQLSQIGLDKTNYPETHKFFFDTLRLWVCLGVADGFKVNYIEKVTNFSNPIKEVYHVGGGSYHDRVDNIWDMRGSYFWRKSLEACGKKDLQNYYRDKYGNDSSNDILAKNPMLASKFSDDFFKITENIINH